MSTITAPAKDWLTALRFIAPAVSSRPAMKSLAGVHITPKSGVLRAFDYEISAEANLSSADGSGKPFLAHKALLLDAIMQTTRTDRSALVEVSHAATPEGRVVTVRAAGYVINFESPDVAEYPPVNLCKVTHSLTVSAKDLKATIQRVGVAASMDDTLPILTAIEFTHSGKVLDLIATDRYRLAWGTVPTVKGTRTSFSFKLKARFAAEVAKRATAGSVNIKLIDGEKVRFDLPGGTLESMVIDGDFPKVRPLFPDECVAEFTVERKPLLNATIVAAALSERNTPAVLDFTSKGVQLLFNVGLFDNSTSPQIAGESTGTEHEPIQTAFNPRFLFGALDALDADRVRVGFKHGDPGKATLFTDADGSGVKHLLMPVRLPQKVQI